MSEFTLPAALAELKSSCEIHCVAGCCGLDAFDIQAHHIEPWISDSGLPRTLEALTQLEELTHTIQGREGRVNSAQDDFGASWEYASECVDFLELLHREGVRALTHVAGGHLFQTDWMSANGGAARSLTQVISDTQDFASLPILADALEDAGCSNSSLLTHCRHGGRHARRCWVVDLLSLGQSLGPLAPRDTLPRRNRVTPFGNLIAVGARGTLMGNRGCLHDEHQRIQQEASGQNRWLLCQLSFKGRKRSLMTPGHYTELFFLDEATGLAAGHRPCAECQRERFNAFRDAFSQGNPALAGGTRLTARAIDLALGRQRLPPGRRRPTSEASLSDLPSGVMVLLEGDQRPFLVQEGRLLPWQPEGYGEPVVRSVETTVRVLTPTVTVQAIAAGYAVGVHFTAKG